jgi:glutathione synthase
MRHLFVMDPLPRINVRTDSTFVVMRECCDRGYEAWMCEPEHLYAADGRLRARARLTQVTAGPPYFSSGPSVDVDLDGIDVIWMRKDPPFDMNYIFTTYLLDLAPEHVEVVNHPVGLKVFNEKLWAMRFPALHPRTLLSRDPGQLQAFVEEQAGRAVLKPWDGNGGRGVLVTQRGDRNLRSMIEILTGDGRQYVICQPYIENVDRGDKRIVLFEGEPVGALLRVPHAGDFRGNMHVGATTAPCDLTERDLEICSALGPELRKHDQVWVGIDVIDGWLTEINITSPTGFQEIRTLYGKVLEVDLVDRIERRVSARRRSE